MARGTARGFFGAVEGRRDAGELRLVDCVHAAGSRLARHSHERAYFCVNHGGHYRETYGRRERTCTPGMVVFHPAGETHAEVHGPRPVASLNVELGPVWLDRMLEFAGPLDQPAQFLGDDISHAGQRLLEEFRNDDRDSTLAIEALTWEILAASLDGRRCADIGHPVWLVEARELLDARLNEAPGLRELAREAGVHPVHFAASFRRFYGCSVGEYTRRRRLQRARRQLANPDLGLAQIAGECGFADQSHFSRTFRRFTGLTPGAYRTFLAFKTR